MLPGYEDHVVDLREDKVLVVTPRATFALWESKISPNTYAEKCNGCRYQHGACLGRACATIWSAGATRSCGRRTTPRRLRRRDGGHARLIARTYPATVT